MNPYVEKLDRLRIKVEANPASMQDFCDLLWTTIDNMPVDEVTVVMDKMFSFAVARKEKDPHSYALACHSKVVVLFFHGQFDEAMALCLQAQKIFESLGDMDGVELGNVFLALMYRTYGEIELAVKYLLGGYHQLSKSGAFKPGLIFCAYNLAEIYSENNQLEEALRYYEVDARLIESMEHPFLLSRIMDGIAVVYLRQKKYALAEEQFNRALQLSREQGMTGIEARILTDLGVYYADMGDYSKAVDYQHQALAIRERRFFKSACVTNWIHLGNVYFKQGKTDEAIGTLTQAQKAAEEIKLKSKAYEIHKLLSDIYQSKGDVSRSYFHFKAYQAIREEVMKENNEKKIKNMQQVFEAEQTKKENVIIKAQKVEIENKNKELQETIDELTITKVSKQAKAITLIIAVVLLVVETVIHYYFVSPFAHNSFFITLGAQGVIVLALKPIENMVEHYLLARIIKKKRLAAMG